MPIERVDPECRPALEAIQAVMTGMNDRPLSERRAMVSAMEAQVAAAAPIPSSVTTEDLTIPGLSGAPDISIRIYRLTGATGAAPGIYYIHGGGMVVGNLESGHADCLRFCRELGAVVVSVDYRLAPENPHPAPSDDCYAGLKWMAENASSLGMDARRIAIYGPSAGGGLAVSTALRARDSGGPGVAFVMAIYPMLDSRGITPSSHAITDLGIWDRKDNEQAWAWYLGGQEPDVYAAPILCADLTGYPPTYMDVGTEDLFRDEDIAFASMLLAAGVQTELHVHPGAFHGSELLAPSAAVSQRQLRRRMAALRTALGVAETTDRHALAHAFAGAVDKPASLAALLHPDATWWLPPSMGVHVQSSRETIVAFRTQIFTEVLERSSVKVDVQDVLVTDQGIAVRVHISATTPTGRAYDNDHSYFLHLRDGLIGNVHEYLDAAYAMAQLHPETGANERGEVQQVAPDHIVVKTSIEIDAPHEVVWAVLTDFNTMPEWSSSFQGLEGDFRDGGRVTAKFRTMGFVQRFDHALRFFEDGVQFGWSDPLGVGFTDKHIYRVEPLLNGRTRLVQTDEPHGPAVRFLGGPIGRQSVSLFQAFNRELKARAERVHQVG